MDSLIAAGAWPELVIRLCVLGDALLGVMLAVYAPRLRPGIPDRVTWTVRWTALLGALWCALLLGAWTFTSWPIQVMAAGAGVLSLLLALVLIRLLLVLPAPVQGQSEGLRDLLTGMLSRTGLMQGYIQLPKDLPVVVAVLDVNGLKQMNDIQGHNAGDVFLQGIATTLAATLPAGSLIGRWGGDEFVAIIPQTTTEVVAEALRVGVQHLPGARPGLPAFAFGLAEAQTPEALERPVAVADERMYILKQRQREVRISQSGLHLPDSLEDYARQLELLDTPQELLAVGLSLSRHLLGYEVAAYYARVDGTFQLLAYSGPPDQRDLHARTLRHLDEGSGPSGEAVRSRRTTWSADYQNDPRAKEEWKQAGLKSVLATPVYDASRLAGLLCLTSFQTWQAVTPQRRYLLESLAQRLGYALERARLQNENEPWAG